MGDDLPHSSPDTSFGDNTSAVRPVPHPRGIFKKSSQKPKVAPKSKRSIGRRQSGNRGRLASTELTLSRYTAADDSAAVHIPEDSEASISSGTVSNSHVDQTQPKKQSDFMKRMLSKFDATSSVDSSDVINRRRSDASDASLSSTFNSSVDIKDGTDSSENISGSAAEGIISHAAHASTGSKVSFAKKYEVGLHRSLENVDCAEYISAQFDKIKLKPFRNASNSDSASKNRANVSDARSVRFSMQDSLDLSPDSTVFASDHGSLRTLTSTEESSVWTDNSRSSVKGSWASDLSNFEPYLPGATRNSTDRVDGGDEIDTAGRGGPESFDLLDTVIPHIDSNDMTLNDEADYYNAEDGWEDVDSYGGCSRTKAVVTETWKHSNR